MGGPPPGDQMHDMSGKWWMNPNIIRRLRLTNEQQKSIEDIFQQNRVRLIDLNASLEKEEAILDPLLSAEHPRESAVFTQIDRVAEARAALEKANTRMLFAFRTQLTSDQWLELTRGR
jgi:Spy/CpxP family protein refolding chaperone